MKLNLVSVSGNLTRDAELKYTNSGTAALMFSVAWNGRRKQGDEWVDEAHYFTVKQYGKSAETVHKYLTKGKPVTVWGGIRQDRWTDGSGNTKSLVYILADGIELGNSATNGESRQPQQQQRAPVENYQPPSQPDGTGTGEMFEDDIPF